MLTEQEIKNFIEKDAESKKKRYARTGRDYYEGKHDILNYRIFFVDADGKVREDTHKTNIKICHPFYKLLVDQQAQYMLSGKEGFVRSDIPELQTELDDYFNDNESFMAELYDLLVGCISKGFEDMYAYKGENDKTAFQCADSLGVVQVKAKDATDNEDHVIYWFIDTNVKDDKKVKRIQVWDKKETHYYAQIDDGAIAKDESVPVNPRPHIIYKKDGDESTYYEDYGVIPFFRLGNGKKQFSGLKPIKALIDDYDLMNAGLSNNIQDTNEAYYVVKGFEGDNLEELLTNFRAKRHIGVAEGGGVDIETVDIPVEARKIKMEVDEKNIFRFGMGVNTEALKDTSATVSVAIKSAYANLDLKCEGLLPSLKQFMRRLLDIVLKEINEAQGSDYQQKDIYFNFEREIITNAEENATIDLTKAQEQQTKVTTILNVASQLGPELTQQLLCEVLELDYDDIKDKLPKSEEDETAIAKAALADIAPEEDEPEGVPGDVIE